MRKVAVAVIGLLVLLVAAGWGYRNFVLIPGARAPLLAGLNDPDSVLFRNEQFVGPWTLTHSTYCAEMNAKNRMGGYAGYRFAMSDGGIEDVSDLFADMPEYCEGRARAVPWWWLRW